MSYTLDDLKSLFKKARGSVLVILIMLVLSLVVLFVYRKIFLIVLGATIAIQLLYSRPVQKKYTEAVNIASLKNSVCKYLNAAIPSEKGGNFFNAKIIKSAELMPCDNEKHGEHFMWQISGNREGFNVSLCDIILPQYEYLSETQRRMTFNSGTWIHIELPKTTELCYKLIDIEAVPAAMCAYYFSDIPQYEAIPLDDEQLRKNFLLYVPTGDCGHVNRGLLRQFKNLVDYTPGHVAFDVKGSQMDVFVKGRFLSRAIAVTEAPTQAMIDSDPFPELSYVVDLAKAVVHGSYGS